MDEIKQSLAFTDVLSIFFVLVCSQHNDTYKKLSIDTEQLLVSAGFPSPGEIPILNGKVFKARRVTIREHPYIASIRRNYAHFLTGTILTKNLILTVAHPLIDVPIYELGVVVGQNYADRGTFINTVIFVIIHKNFDRFTLERDIAILRLFENLVFKGSIKSISVRGPKKELNGVTAFVSGWGRCDNLGTELCLPRSSKYNRDEIIDPMLRSVSFTLNEPNYYCDGYIRNEIKFKPGMLCIGPAREENPTSPCLAVPGAPLVVNASLVALSSWGFGCGYVFDLPLVYTDIASNAAWIINHTRLHNQIKSENITFLFKATKAYILLKWINETRVIKPTFSLRPHRLLLPLDIDRQLSATRDVVLDIRDYIKSGAYRSYKMYIYDEYRLGNLKMEKLKLYKPTVQTRPFLSKELFDDIEFK